MSYRSQSLDEFFLDAVRQHTPLVLATVVSTIGSTYRKPGAQMLIAADGRSAGLLSGGCLESDLFERARSVLETGQALVVEYDSRGPDDVLWGIGLGCEGAMRILLTRLDSGNGYEPYAFAVRSRRDDRGGAIAFVVESRSDGMPLGLTYRSEEQAVPAALRDPLARLAAAAPQPKSNTETVTTPEASFLVMSVPRPTRLLVLGAGPDVLPLVEIAGLLDWHVTVLDHRPAYAIANRFPRAQKVGLRPAAELAQELAESRYDAAVVMSHHLPSDEQYLRALADSTIPYVGLLGPAARRARLLHDIGPRAAAALDGRLYGPVGLDIGATTPEAIALSIVAEIQAVRAGRSGGSFSAHAATPALAQERKTAS